MSSAADRQFCEEMLPKVSRTFAVCIRLLPAPLAYSVLVAYLLCRVADTIEDSTRMAPADKNGLFARFRSCLNEGGPDAAPLAKAFPPTVGDEERLTHNTDAVLREYRRLPESERRAIRPWVQEMCDGMADFVRRGGESPIAHLRVLATVEELDRYCYYVAGTVGHLLTDLFRLHDGRLSSARVQRLESLATSFGLGLQLTNIIKDVSNDRQRGWSFVPRQLCHLVGVNPEDLQDDAHREAGRHVMLMMIGKAKAHLNDALEYATALPRRHYGIRLFCLTSLFFAVRTLRLAEHDDRLLDPNHKVKITRAAVYRTIAMTRVFAPSNRLTRAYFWRLAGAAWRHGTKATLTHPELLLEERRPTAPGVR